MKIIISILAFLSIAYGKNLTLPSYDLESITPETWQQVTLNYNDIIDGKEYPAEIKLLRPIEWLKANGIDEVGNKALFSLPEFGVDSVEVNVTEINATNIDTSNIDWQKQSSRPVITTFKRYAEDVRTYSFKDEQGNIEKINVTPNHPFYVKSKADFVEIDKISVSDKLVSQTGKQVKLVCPVGQESSCGQRYNKYFEPIEVYNLEVYHEHVYFVGHKQLLVHNTCLRLKDLAARKLLSSNLNTAIRVDTRTIEEISSAGGFKTQVFANEPRSIHPDHVLMNAISAVEGSGYEGAMRAYRGFSGNANALAPKAAINVYEINMKGFSFLRFDNFSLEQLKSMGAPLDAHITGEIQLYGPITVDRIRHLGKLGGSNFIERFINKQKLKSHSNSH